MPVLSDLVLVDGGRLVSCYRIVTVSIAPGDRIQVMIDSRIESEPDILATVQTYLDNTKVVKPEYG